MLPLRPWQGAWERLCAHGGWSCEQLRLARPGGLSGFAWQAAPRHVPRGWVIFLHGMGNDALFPQLPLLRDIVAAGWGVVTLDLDGHGIGGSSRLLPDSGSQMIAEVWPQLAVRFHPSAPVHLIGYSVGGAFALGASAIHRHLASLVVLAMPLRVEISAMTGLLELSSAITPSVLRQLRWCRPYDLIPALGTFKRDSYPLRLGASWPDYARAADEIIARVDAPRRLQGLRLPHLVLTGTRDGLVPPRQRREWQAVAVGATYEELPGETHFSLLMAPRLAGRIVRWLQSTAP